jgi:Fe-S cluster assembly iron-binding protein IscA
MLTLTPPAVQAVNAMAMAYGSSDTGGLRIARTGGTGDTAEAVMLEVEFVDSPADEDQVVTQGGARIFVEQEAAVYLTDKVLDGDIDDEGHAHFALGRQPVDGDQPQPPA